MESNDSPEIPDRGETSDIPGLPSGEGKGDKANRGRGGKEGNIREWAGLEFAKSQRAVVNREKWRKLVAKSPCS